MALVHAFVIAVVLGWAVVGLALANQHFIHARWGGLFLSVGFALFPAIIYLSLNRQKFRLVAAYARRVRNAV